MAKIELLDCTLRDGAYDVNGDFVDDVIVGLIKKLDAANADIIECGWLKDAPHKDGSVYYHVPEDVRKYMPWHRKSVATYTVMPCQNGPLAPSTPFVWYSPTVNISKPWPCRKR